MAERVAIPINRGALANFDDNIRLLREKHAFRNREGRPRPSAPSLRREPIPHSKIAEMTISSKFLLRAAADRIYTGDTKEIDKSLAKAARGIAALMRKRSLLARAKERRAA